jgi:hypothetical protein
MKDGEVHYPRFASALMISSLALAICGNALAQPPSLVHVANNTDLSALAHNAFAAVMRDGHTIAGDAPPLVFIPSATGCTLNSGAGDGGSQVPTSDGGCWNATLSGPLDGREWGATYPLTLYFSSGGSNAGPNYCFSSAHPCTFQGAINQAQQTNARGSTLKVQDSVPSDSLASGIDCNGANGSPNAIYVDGQGSTLADTTAAPAAIIAENGCFLAVENWTITSLHGSDLFPGANSQVFIGPGMNFGPSQLGQIHVESGALAQIGNGYTISGGAPAHIEAVLGGHILYDETAVTVALTNSAFTGSSTGATLTVSAVLPGSTLTAGQTITGGTLAGNTVILSQLTGSTGGTGTYDISPSQNVSSASMVGMPAFATAFASLQDGSVLYAPQSTLTFSGSATGRRYFIQSNSVIETNTAAPSLFPGNAGGQMVTGAKLTPMPAPMPLSSFTGLGVGGTAVLVAGSDQTTGAIQLTAGSSATAATGLVTINMADGGAPNILVPSFTLALGTGTWSAGALTQLAGVTATSVTLEWFNNGSPLSTGQTYYITYVITPR